eukprot:2018959-Prymnesium_polylepis.1
MDGAPSGQAEPFPLTSVRKYFCVLARGAPRESKFEPRTFALQVDHHTLSGTAHDWGYCWGVCMCVCVRAGADARQ